MKLKISLGSASERRVVFQLAVGKPWFVGTMSADSKSIDCDIGMTVALKENSATRIEHILSTVPHIETPLSEDQAQNLIITASKQLNPTPTDVRKPLSKDPYSKLTESENQMLAYLVHDKDHVFRKGHRDVSMESVFAKYGKAIKRTLYRGVSQKELDTILAGAPVDYYTSFSESSAVASAFGVRVITIKAAPLAFNYWKYQVAQLKLLDADEYDDCDGDHLILTAEKEREWLMPAYQQYRCLDAKRLIFEIVATGSVSATTTWTRPGAKDLALEYQYEYMLPTRNWPARCRSIGAKYPLFVDLADFISKVKSASVETLDANSSVHNTTNMATVGAVRELVSQYQFPRDVDRILSGFTSGAKMPMPIIVRGPKGSWILSGNTRSNLAHVLKIPVKALWIDVD